MRYAETLLAAGDADAALAEASKDMPSSFEGSQQELLGDIYLAKNDKDAAIKSYKNAWELVRKRQETRAVLALKMESLGVVAEPIAEPASLIQASKVAPDNQAVANASNENATAIIAAETTQ